MALIAAGIAIVPATAAQATHFRFRDLTWRYDHALEGGVGNVVELTMRIADRRSFYGGSLAVGSPFSAPVTTGDGGSASLTGSVVAVNTVDDWFIAEVRGFHTYATAGPYQVSWTGCCTLSTLRNSRDSSLRTTTVINMGNGNTASPLSLVSPIVHLPAKSAVQTIRIPATDPDGGNVIFRLATQSESLVTQPPGLTVDSRTGVLSWDTTGRPNGLWMATVVLADSVGASTMNTFLINLGGTASAPPAWTDPTPPDRSNLTAPVGGSKQFTLAAADPDGDRVHITPLNAPPGLTCAESADGNRTDLFCQWLPTATGTYLIAFDAQDSTGASAGLRSYRVTAPRLVGLGDSYSSGEGALNAANYEPGTDGDTGGNKCRRASTAYPQLVSSHINVQLHFVACSGARTYDMFNPQTDGALYQQDAQFDRAALGQDVDYVTMTIGGNDAGFANILKECAGGEELLPWNDCSTEPEKSEQPVQDAFARLRGQEPQWGGGESGTRPLAEIYERILREAPRARVIVLGYPQFFKSSGTAFLPCSGISKTDQRWTNDKVAEMNGLVRDEAVSLGLEFVETTPLFEGHRLCEIGGGEDREWFRDIQLDSPGGDDTIMDPAGFHPDDDGHVAMAQAVISKIESGAPPAITMTTGDVTEFYVDVLDVLQDWLNLFARWPGSDVEMTITSPSGKVYHRSAVPSDAKHLLGPTFESFRIPHPEVGRWRVKLFGADLGADGEPVTFTSSLTPKWNRPPVAQISHTVEGRRLHLDARGSTDPDGDQLVGYRWFISDSTGTFAELDGAVADYTFDRAGDFGISLRVEDAAGKSGYAGIRQPVHVARLYDVTGPGAPLDPDADWTTLQAGRTLPVTWRLTKDGQPVAEAASFGSVTSTRVDCATGAATAEVVDGDTAGSSGLSYHGDGRWQFNWQTAKSWSDTCRLMTVTFDDGSTMTAKLAFK